MTELVARRCRDHDGDERSLRIALLDDLRGRVPFAWHVWALTDPETEVAIAPLATVPDHLMAQLPGIIRRRYLTPVNRWDTHRAAPSESLHRATNGAPSESLLHRRSSGRTGSATSRRWCSATGSGAGGSSTCGAQWTTPRSPTQELDVLAEDVPAITDALRRCQARTLRRTGVHRTGRGAGGAVPLT